jgi:hypothetical protein
VAHGGRSGSLRRALRSQEAGGVLRRDALPNGGREAHSHPGQAGMSPTLRLRVRAQRGAQNLFMFFEPKASWRHVDLKERRTAIDFARQMSKLADEHYPEAQKIRVVLDNLNTHTPAALYEAFEPREAKRILSKLEFHYTPLLHGSWLNQVEIEFSVLCRECIGGRRIPDEGMLQREVAAWEKERNEKGATVDWRFSVEAARTKLERLYPAGS